MDQLVAGEDVYRMAITFACSCGKRLQARAEFAGRRIKCPKCATILQIPDGPTVAPAPKAARPMPPPIKRPNPVLAEHAIEVMQVKEAARVVTLEKPVPRSLVTVASGQTWNPWVDYSLEQHPTPWPADAPEAGRPEPPDPRDQD